MFLPLLVAICGVVMMTGNCVESQDGMTKTFVAWTFDQAGDNQGWSIPDELRGRVWGGALWLTIQPPEADVHQVGLPQPAKASFIEQMFAGKITGPIVSPQGLAVPVQGNVKLRMRILNSSSETDGFIWWRLSSNPDVDAGLRRFSMKPYSREWQEVVCDLVGAHEELSQVRIQPYVHGLRGDIYIDSIRITDGPPPETPPRPDVCSDAVTPQVELPGVRHEDFQDAFKVLDECIFLDVPVMGFPFPVMGPGGAYGENWWQLDTSLNQAGTKWANQSFSENIIRGFMAVQDENPDGRIDLWGGAPIRGQNGDVSSIPRYFEIAYDVARRSSDADFREASYASMKDYLDWWLSPVKRKQPTGLISATAEETFAANILDPPGILAAVDTNVAVAVGCSIVSTFAERLGKAEDAKHYREAFDELKNAINMYLWNNDQGFYCNYNILENHQISRLLCTTFDTLRLGIATPERAEILIEKLTDPDLFNWGSYAITSIAKTEPDYVEATGTYDGRAWSGDIWTMRNMPVISGLEDLGRYDLAANLAWSTVKAFNANYCEYVVPTTGSGEGVKRYGWSASQYIQSIVEHIFGVDYDAMADRLVVAPNLPKHLGNLTVSLRNLQLCAPERRLDVYVTREESGNVRVHIELRGDLPGELWVAVPGAQGSSTSEDGATAFPLQIVPGMAGVMGIRIEPANKVRVDFSP